MVFKKFRLLALWTRFCPKFFSDTSYLGSIFLSQCSSAQFRSDSWWQAANGLLRPGSKSLTLCLVELCNHLNTSKYTPTFLHQSDHTLSNDTRNGLPGKPVVEHIRQNRVKHVRHPQVHFVGQIIQSWWLVEADRLQQVMDFVFSNQTLTASRFRLPMLGEVG